MGQDAAGAPVESYQNCMFDRQTSKFDDCIPCWTGASMFVNFVGGNENSRDSCREFVKGQ